MKISSTSFILSFKSRLFLSFLSFVLVILVWGVSYLIVDYKQKELNHFTSSLNFLQIQYFKSVSALDKFTLSGFHDSTFYKTEHQQDIDQFLSLQKDIFRRLIILKKEAANHQMNIQEDLHTLSQIGKQIDQSGRLLRHLYFKKGFVDYGTEGQMRQYAHWIENSGKVAKVDILQLRRHEKDFIMRGKAMYESEYFGTVDSLIKLRRRKDSTYVALVNYKNKFRDLVNYSNKLGIYGTSGVLPETQNEIAEFNKILIHTYSVSNNEIVYLKGRLTTLLIIISVFFLVFVIILGYALSRYLTADIKELNQRVEAFINSDFQHIDLLQHENTTKPHSIEIQRLFNDFDHLKVTIQNYINNLNLRTEELQGVNAELKARSDEVKSVNEELKYQREQEHTANQRYHYATKATSDAIWDWDLTNDTLIWGEGFKIIFGYDIQNIHRVVDSLIKYLHPEDADRVIKGIQTIISGQHTNWRDEYRYLKADGTYAYVVDRGFVLRNEKGVAIRMVGAMHDISRRKKEEQRLKLLESVITNANDAVVITEAEPFDEPGPRIVYVNEAFTRMTGYSAEEVLGKTPRILQGLQSDTEELKHLGNEIRNWQSCEITTVNYKKSGEEYWVNLSVSPVSDDKGSYTHFVSIQRDITARKKEQMELKLFADELFIRNKELHQFGYVISHNLRSPIANIMGIADLLELDKDDPETLERCTKDLKTAVYSLDNVVKDLSKILSITDGSVELAKEKVDLSIILNNIKNDLKKVIKHSKATIQIPANSYLLFSHKAYLYSIFYNLISNAIKYKSNKNPEITIDIRPKASFLEISISDNGLGIDLVKNKDDLFKPYKRFNLSVEGKGLGLFLVKSHVEALGGKITVESQIGKGASFTIILPVNKATFEEVSI